MKHAVRLFAVALLLVLVAGAAAAQSEAPIGPSVVAVDASTSRVELVVMNEDYSLGASDVQLTEYGEPVQNLAVATARGQRRPTEIIFVVDTDNRTLANGLLAEAGSVIGDAVEALPPEVRIGLVSAGEQAVLETRLSTDRDRFRRDFALMTAGRGSALYDAVDLAADAFTSGPGTVRSLVVLSGGPDTASESTGTATGAILTQKGVQVLTVHPGNDAALDALVARTGGARLGLPDDGPDQPLRSAVSAAANRLLVSYTGNGTVGERVALSLDLGGRVTNLTYPAGVTTLSSLQLATTPDTGPAETGFFGQPIVLYVSVALAALAITGAVWSLGSIYAGGESMLDKRLARYSDPEEQLDEEETQEMLVQAALIRRAVDMTESFAARQGFLARVEELLERANLPIRAGEALFFLSMLVVVVLGVVSVATGNLIVGAILAAVAGVVGYFVVVFMAKRRLKAFEGQLPDTLQLLAGTLRAGYSLPQGIDAVSTEIADPMGYELRRAITEAQLGRELDEALSGIADRLNSPDFAWAVMAIGIQREVGGNLNELLMTVAETMIQRERLKREVAALTAEGRVSAGILAMLPPGLGFVMWVMNPDYIGVLFSRTLGMILIGVAIVSATIGMAWMKKVITIDA